MVEEKDYLVKNMLYVLLLFFSIFVLGDILTTAWLIHNDPKGIMNEANPYGATLYIKYGIAGLIIGKIAFFIPFSTLMIFTYSKYIGYVWFRRTCEVVVLGLIAYSLVVFLNNIVALFILSALKGLPYILQLLPIIKAFIILFSLSLEVAMLGLAGIRERVKNLEAVIGTLLIVVPLFFYDPLYSYLSRSPHLFYAYIASAMVIIAIAFYITEEILKERRKPENP